MKYSNYFSAQNAAEKKAEIRKEEEKWRKAEAAKKLIEQKSSAGIQNKPQIKEKQKYVQSENLKTKQSVKQIGVAKTDKSYKDNAYLDRKYEEAYAKEINKKEGYQNKLNYDVAKEKGITKTSDNKFYKSDGTEVSEDWLNGGFYTQEDANKMFGKMFSRQSNTNKKPFNRENSMQMLNAKNPHNNDEDGDDEQIGIKDPVKRFNGVMVDKKGNKVTYDKRTDSYLTDEERKKSDKNMLLLLPELEGAKSIVNKNEVLKAAEAEWHTVEKTKTDKFEFKPNAADFEIEGYDIQNAKVDIGKGITFTPKPSTKGSAAELALEATQFLLNSMQKSSYEVEKQIRNEGKENEETREIIHVSSSGDLLFKSILKPGLITYASSLSGDDANARVRQQVSCEKLYEKLTGKPVPPFANCDISFIPTKEFVENPVMGTYYKDENGEWVFKQNLNGCKLELVMISPVGGNERIDILDFVQNTIEENSKKNVKEKIVN